MDPEGVKREREKKEDMAKCLPGRSWPIVSGRTGPLGPELRQGRRSLTTPERRQNDAGTSPERRRNARKAERRRAGASSSSLGHTNPRRPLLPSC